MSEQIKIDDFRKVELRVGKVVEATAHPNADRLNVLKVDIGGGEQRQLVAGVRKWYEPESMVGKTVIVLVNLQPATLRGVESQGMVLAATDEAGENVVVLTVDRDIPPGSKVS